MAHALDDRGPDRLHVLHLTDKLTVGRARLHGVAQLLAWWIPEFDRRRFDVAGASLRGRDAAGRHLERCGVPMFYLPRRKLDPRTLTDLLWLIRSERLDILHLHGYKATTFGRAASAVTGVPAVIHEHMSDARVPAYQRLADRALARATTHAFAVSDSVREFLVRRRHVPADRVETLYSGVPLERFPVPAGRREDAPWRREAGVPADDLVVAIVGRLHPIKGHGDFIEAARRVLERFSRVTFVVVGDGELLPRLRQQAREAGLAGKLRFLGHRDDIPYLLAGVDIHVIASLSEGVPLTLFEAMACGCAVVATRVGGVGEVLRNGDTGLLVPPADPQTLAGRLLLLLADGGRRAELGRRARRAVEKYDLPHTVRRFERVYEDLVRRRFASDAGRPLRPGALPRGAP